MKIDARISHSKVRFDQDNNLQLVVSLTAPSTNSSAERPKLALAVCLDVSGSMTGQKIDYAKKSIGKLIEHLKPTDQLSIVTFGSYSRTVFKLANMSSEKKDEARKLLSSISINGGTNLSGGMLNAIEELRNADLGSNYIQRVILFTDGQPNEGVARTPAEIIKCFKANAPDYITASTFGYGRGQGGDFDPVFLSELAREAKGNYAHVEDPDKALQAFGTELGGLISTYGTKLNLVVTPLKEHRITKVISDVDAEEDVTGDVTIEIPDILAEETRNLVFDLKLGAQKTHGPRSVNAVSVSLSFETFDVTGKKESKTAEAKAKVQFVKPGEESTEIEKDLMMPIQLAQLVRAQIEAEAMAKKGEYKVAGDIMRGFAHAAASQGSAALAGLATAASLHFNDAVSYSTGQGYLQGTSRAFTRSVGGSYSTDVRATMDCLGLQANTSSQAAVSNAFTGQSSTGVVVGGGMPEIGGVVVPTVTGSIVPTSGYLNTPIDQINGYHNGVGAAVIPAIHVEQDVKVDSQPKEAESPHVEAIEKAAKKARLKQTKSKTNW